MAVTAATREERARAAAETVGLLAHRPLPDQAARGLLDPASIPAGSRPLAALRLDESLSEPLLTIGELLRRRYRTEYARTVESVLGHFELTKTGPQRTVARWSNRDQTTYIKWFHCPTWNTRLRDWWRGGLARHEAQRHLDLLRDGLPVPRVVGWCSAGAGHCGLLLTEAVEQAEPLSRWWKQARLARSSESRRAVLTKLGRLMRACWDAGWVHLDFHADNVLVAPGCDGWDLTLVDVAGFRRSTSPQDRWRQFAQWRHSLHRELSAPDVARCAVAAGLLEGSAPREQRQHQARALMASLRRESAALWRRQDRKWARGNRKQHVLAEGRALAEVPRQDAATWLQTPCEDLPATWEVGSEAGSLTVRRFRFETREAAFSCWLKSHAKWRRGETHWRAILVGLPGQGPAWLAMARRSLASARSARQEPRS